MKIAETCVLATIVDSDGETQPITAVLECADYKLSWTLLCGGDDAQTGKWDTLWECLESARQSWEGGDWRYEITEEGRAICECEESEVEG